MPFLLMIVVVCVLFALINKKEKIEQKPIVREVQSTRTLEELITSIDYGRVYPYYTGMSFTEVKELFKYFCVNYSKDIKIYESAGVASLISLPDNLNPHIDEIILGFNENNVINSISIVIKDFDECKAQLKELMCTKFGAHTPSDGRYITWGNLRMGVRVDEIDEIIEVFYSKCLIY